jgi:hypothetical protein
LISYYYYLRKYKTKKNILPWIIIFHFISRYALLLLYLCGMNENKNQKHIPLNLDQNNSAFNIHHIPSSISLETPSERSASIEPSNHEQPQQQQQQKKSNLNLNLPNGNLPNSPRKLSFSSSIPSSSPPSSTILTITNELEDQEQREQQQQQQQPQSSSRKLSKLSIMDPIDSIC